MGFFWAFFVIVGGLGFGAWITAPLWQNRDVCPYGCRTISHDGGPYGVPIVYDYDNPECPDHGGK